jgi:AcrR family transcriptional regulator
VLEEGMSVARVAARRGVTRGAIYQQLRRVVEVLPTVMEEIEVPHFEIG